MGNPNPNPNRYVLTLMRNPKPDSNRYVNRSKGTMQWAGQPIPPVPPAPPSVDTKKCVSVCDSTDL